MFFRECALESMTQRFRLFFHSQFLTYIMYIMFIFRVLSPIRRKQTHNKITRVFVRLPQPIFSYRLSQKLEILW